MSDPELWHLERAGERHEVALTDGLLSRRIVWRVDGVEVAAARTHDDWTTLVAAGHGSIGLHLSTLGATRRVTWFHHDNHAAAQAAVRTLVGGEDLVPEPGSTPARRLASMRRHPRGYAVRRTAGAAAGVVVGVLVTWLAGRLISYLAGRITLPDWLGLPRIPWPDLPWPDIDWPRIPWPDLALPGWSTVVLDAARFVVPVAIALILATREVRRQRRRADRDADRARDSAADREPSN